MFTAALVLSLATLAPAADTPTEPIDSTLIEMGLTLPDGVELCATTSEMGGLINELAALGGPEVGVMFKDMAVAYFADTFQDGMGPNSVFTAEAENVFETWVRGCLG